MSELFTTTDAVCRALMADTATSNMFLRLVPCQKDMPESDDILWSDILVFDPSSLRLSLDNLGHCIDATPLYRHAIEIEVDKALFKLSLNDTLPEGLEHKLNVTKGTLRNARKSGLDDGTLCNMFLEHIDGVALVNLLHILDNDVQGTIRGSLRGLAALLGRHPDILSQKIDGWIFNETGHGHIFLSAFLTKAKRKNTQPEIDLEDSVAAGRNAVLAMHTSEPEMHLNAWLELDTLQARICAALDCVFRLCQFPGLPPFARSDLFTLMKLEAMKQVHAERIATIAHLSPAMQQALTIGQQGFIDPALEKLVSQLLGYNGSYAGQAGPFLTESARRSKVTV